MSTEPIEEEPQYAKVATLRISVGVEDERSIEEFIQDAKDALQPLCKNVTALGGYYLIDGQPVRADGTHALTGKPTKEPEKKAKARKTTKAKVKAPEPEPEPEAEEGIIACADCGELVLVDGATYSADGYGDLLCEPCADEREGQKGEAREEKEEAVRSLARKTLSMRKG